MANDKFYSEVSTPNHKMIKLLKKKGYTHIEITWHGAMSKLGRGFRLTCLQISWMKLGACLDTAMENIKKLPDIDNG